MSNFYPAPFIVDGTRYINSEQYIQSKKALLFKSPETSAKILASSNPGEMKRLTSNLPVYKKTIWEEQCPEIGYIAIRNKYNQNPHLLELLKSTGEKILVEASPNDNLWGIGLDKKHKDILAKKKSWGQNLQGGILMRVRTELQGI
jgi:ribA/ribD-fused uncharacterized protein